MDERWFEDLREMREAVRPTGDALPRVRRRIQRRRQRRALGGALSVACAVGVVIAAVGFPPWTPPGEAPTTGAGTPTPTRSTLFDCPLGGRVFGPAPPIPDVDRQERIIGAADQLRWKAFAIKRMVPTHLGVVTLVSGDLGAAREVLPALGIQHIYAWDPTAGAVGVDGAGQVRQVLRWLLEPTVRDVHRAYRGIAGYQGLALWPDAGAVVLRWKAPIPNEITALAGVRPDGVELIVEPTRYSARELRTAGTRVTDAIRAHHVDGKWTMAHACADGSGLVVGIAPASLGERRAQLQKQLAGIAGLPVRVVSEEAPVPLTPNR